MRATALTLVYDLAKKDSRVQFIGSDLGVGTLKQFKAEMPDRYFMDGVSEQHLVGMAAGLAMDGNIPYINTIATFLSRRCYEQNVLDLGLHNLKVRLLASGGGVVYAPLGPTHLATDDIAIMRAIPNMTIVAPCDAEEMKRLMPLTLEHEGPMYIRFGKGNDPVVSRPDLPFKIGKAIVAHEGPDALIVTTGITLKTALDALPLLATQGLSPTILHCHTVKPLDVEAIRTHAARVPVIVTVEEHTLMGGLGSAVGEAVLEANYDRPKRFKRLGIPDVFPKKYGTQAQLMESFGLSAQGVAAAVTSLSGERQAA
jgi:transketolase